MSHRTPVRQPSRSGSEDRRRKATFGTGDALQHRLSEAVPQTKQRWDGARTHRRRSETARCRRWRRTRRRLGDGRRHARIPAKSTREIGQAERRSESRVSANARTADGTIAFGRQREMLWNAKIRAEFVRHFRRFAARGSHNSNVLIRSRRVDAVDDKSVSSGGTGRKRMPFLAL